MIHKIKQIPEMNVTNKLDEKIHQKSKYNFSKSGEQHDVDSSLIKQPSNQASEHCWAARVRYVQNN